MAFNSRNGSGNGNLFDAANALTITSVIDLNGRPVSSGGIININDGLLSFSGTATPYAAVFLSVDGQRYPVLADAEGNWSRRISVPVGVPDIRVTSLGSSATFELTVEPAPPLTQPLITMVYADDQGFNDYLFSGGSTQDATPGLVGEAPAGSTVQIMVNDQVVGSVVADEQGQWSYHPQLELGPNTIVVSANGEASEPFWLDYQLADTNVPAPQILFAHADEGSGWHIGNGDFTDDRTPQIQGQAAPNAQLEVMINGRVVGSVSADQHGNWSYSPTLDEGRNEISVAVQGQVSNIFVIDYAQAPAQTPQILFAHADEGSGWHIGNGGFTDDRTPQIQGQATPNTQLDVMINGRVVGSVSADQHGNWSYSPTLDEGRNEISVADQGQVSDVFVVDYQSVDSNVSAPNIQFVYSDEETVRQIVNGGVTDDRTPQLHGQAAPNTQLDVIVNGRVVDSISTDAFGNWSYSPTLNEGRNEISVAAQGLVSDVFVVGYLPADSTVTTPNIQFVYSDEETVRQIVNGGVTDDRTPQLHGQAAPNTQLDVIVNGRVVDSISTDAFGNWSYSPTLNEGRNEISVAAQGQVSDVFVVGYLPADSTVTTPNIQFVYSDEETVRQIVNGGVTDDRTPQLHGQAAPNTQLDVIVNGRVVDSISTDAFGNWSYSPTLNEGRNEISVAAQGQVSDIFVVGYLPASVEPVQPIDPVEPELPVQPIDPVEPATPGEQVATISAFLNESGELTTRQVTLYGQASANAIVILHANGREIGSVIASDNGNWSFLTSLGDGASVLQVSVDGAFSDELSVTVVGSPQPEIQGAFDNFGQQGSVASGGFSDDRAAELRGIAGPEAVIGVYLGSQRVGEVQADINGYWSFIPTLEMGLNQLHVVENGIASQVFEITIEDAPRITGVYDSDNMLVEEGAETSSLELLVAGRAQPNAWLELHTMNALPIRVQADENGDWSVELAPGDAYNFISVYSNGQYSEGFSFNYVYPQGSGFMGGDESLMLGAPMVAYSSAVDMENLIQLLSTADVLSDVETHLFSQEQGFDLSLQSVELVIQPEDMDMQTLMMEGIELSSTMSPTMDVALREELQYLGAH